MQSNTKTLIHNAEIVNENQKYRGSILIEGEFIKKIFNNTEEATLLIKDPSISVIEAEGLCLIPGMIDDQVHFRDPGLTHKGDLYTESRAAIAGGITSLMEMPNTNPRTITADLLKEKFELGKNKSWANYSFYMGTTNDNFDEIVKINPNEVCGIKIFLGASTGNMLVDNHETIEAILKFSARTGLIVTVHSEDEAIIQSNVKKYKEQYGEEIGLEMHSEIRSREACYKCSEWIIGLAKKHQANLHILHLSTADEIALLENIPLEQKKITAEVCIHHLWFTKDDHKDKGSFIKWNPAIKDLRDREALRKALKEGYIDILATDHAPHTLEEKSSKNYFTCPSGGPLVQDVLIAALELYHQGVFSLEEVIEKSSHNVAKRFKIDRRGFIREGYYADLVLVDLNTKWTRDKSNILYKCAWSPFEGTEFHSKVISTFVNGDLVYNKEKFSEAKNSQALVFRR